MSSDHHPNPSTCALNHPPPPQLPSPNFTRTQPKSSTPILSLSIITKLKPNHIYPLPTFTTTTPNITGALLQLGPKARQAYSSASPSRPSHSSSQIVLSHLLLQEPYQSDLCEATGKPLGYSKRRTAALRNGDHHCTINWPPNCDRTSATRIPSPNTSSTTTAGPQARKHGVFLFRRTSPLSPSDC